MSPIDTQTPIAPPVVPPLRDGDRMDRFEFARRYEAMPEVKKAELIEGVVHMPSPVNAGYHGTPHLCLCGVIDRFIEETEGIEGAVDSTVRLSVVNEPQPDLTLYILPECGGQVRLEKGWLEQSPEMTIEVAASSKSRDRGAKFAAYQRAGVKEYLICYGDEGRIDLFALAEDSAEQIDHDEAGVLRSRVFPGLWIDVPGVLACNRKRYSGTLRRGLASPEHAAFVADLAARRAGGS